MTVRLTHTTVGADLRYFNTQLQARPGWQWAGNEALRLVRRFEDGWFRFQRLYPRPPAAQPRSAYEHAERLIFEALLRFPAAEFSQVTISQAVQITIQTSGVLADVRPVFQAAGLTMESVRLRDDFILDWAIRREVDVLSPSFLDLCRRIATVVAVLDQVVTAGDLVVESIELLEAA